MASRKPFVRKGWTVDQRPTGEVFGCLVVNVRGWGGRKAEDEILVTVREVQPPCKHPNRLNISFDRFGRGVSWCRDCGMLEYNGKNHKPRRTL